MAIATMPMTDQEMPPANDLGDRTPREENEERQAQETVSTLRDANEDISTPEAHIPEPDQAVGEESQETPSQEMDNELPDASLHECRVEMVPLDDIYAGSDPYDDELNDDLIKALAHSIGLIGLQNPICIVANDIPDNPASYRLVSGRKRYTAFLKLKRTTIPAHILSYAETDSEKDFRKALATTEENLVRKHYSLIELCELVGKSKAMYERIHPDAMQGKAPKGRKDSTVESFQPVSYLTLAAQQLGKCRATVWKYVSIYSKLIQGHPEALTTLQQCDHSILSKLQDLQELAKSQDLEILTRFLCGLEITPGDRKSKPCTLQEAQKRLAQYRAEQARENQPPQYKASGNSGGQELPPPPAENPISPSTLVIPASSSALEISAPQLCNSTTPPPAEEGLVVTPQPEAPTCVDPSSDEVLDSVEEVLIALERHITRYVDVHAPHRFTRFTIATKRATEHELHVIIEERV